MQDATHDLVVLGGTRCNSSGISAGLTVSAVLPLAMQGSRLTARASYMHIYKSCPGAQQTTGRRVGQDEP